MALSDTYLKSNLGKERERVLEKSDRDGLWIRLSKKGAVTFFYRFRFLGKADKMTIGSYPQISLKQARDEVTKWAAALAAGSNPKIKRDLELSKIQTAATFEQLFREWFEVSESSKKCADQVLRSFELHVFPKVGKYPANDITLHHWLSLFDALAKVYTGVTKRILNNTRRCYSWAYKRGAVDSNPLSELSSRDFGIENNVGERTLSKNEIAFVWKACEESRMSVRNQLIIKLCLFYGCRVSELRLAEKSHFDFESGIWTVPVDNRKMGKKLKEPILRPIIPDVIPLLQEAINYAPGKYVFSNRELPMPSGNHLSITGMLCKFMLKVYKETVPHFTVHDLRRTARTNWSEFTDPHVAEMMLGHKIDGIQGVYDKYKYLDEMRKAYSLWWARLMSITEENIIEFKRQDRAS